jgi:choice-of-anchor B domain-containing protein
LTRTPFVTLLRAGLAFGSLFGTQNLAVAQLSKSAVAPLDGDGKGDFDVRPQAEGFGAAVAIAGNLAFVGEPEGTLVTGTVTVYHRDSVSGIWSKEGVLTPSGGSAGNGFGERIDADAERVIVGAPDAFGGVGAAYVFSRLAPGVWQEEGVLQSSAPATGRWYARYGLSISGDYAAVGEALSGGSNQGALHVYKFDSGSWAIDTTITGTDRFGFGVAVSGSRVAGSAYRWPTSGSSARVGRVLLYERSGDTWTQSDQVTMSDSIQFDYFGFGLELDGDRLVVGNNSVNGIRSKGYRMYDYSIGSSSWVLQDSVNSLGYFALDLDSAAVISGSSTANLVTIHTRSASGTMILEDTLAGIGVGVGDEFGYDVGVSGNYAVVGAPGNFIGSSDAYFFERQPDGSWAQVAAFQGAGPPASITGAAVPCSGGIASSFACKDVDLQAFLNRADLLVTGNLSDVWGWTDSVTGHEYALVTHGGGVTFVDVTDSENPVVVGLLPLRTGTNNSAWRDVKTYADHAFIVADNAGPQGIQVFDLTALRTAQGLSAGASKTQAAQTSLPVTFSETAHYDKFSKAHNIAINESSGTAFVVGGDICDAGIHIVDITVPTAPDSTGCYADATTGRAGTGYTHDIQCVTYSGPDSTYAGREICFGSNETAVLISDVTPGQPPSTVGKAEYPDYGYVHQGWLTDDHRYFVLDDELDERSGLAAGARTLIWDVTDLTDPVLVHEYLSPTPAVDHNQYVQGDHLYQAQYSSGLRILDISGVTGSAQVSSKGAVVSPVEVGYFDTYPPSDGTLFVGAWSVYPYFQSGNVIVTGIGEGLFVLRPQLSGVSVDVTVLLEGAHVGGSDSMATSPLFKTTVPTANPFQRSRFDGTPLELDAPDSVSVLPAGSIDWVGVELRIDPSSGSAVMNRAAILLADGSVVDPNGAALSFPGVAADSYYVVVRHRNHMSVMSSSAVDLSSGSGSWNFATSESQAYGSSPMKSLEGGFWGMFAGDADLNGQSTANDFNDWLVNTKATLTGYLLTDFDLDGQVTASDFNVWLANAKAVSTSKVPE